MFHRKKIIQFWNDMIKWFSFCFLYLFLEFLEENNVSNWVQICHDSKYILPRSNDLNYVIQVHFIAVVSCCTLTVLYHLCLFLLLLKNLRRNIWDKFINWLWKSKIWAVKCSSGFLHLLLVKGAGCFAVLAKLGGLYYHGSIEEFLEKG